MSARRVRLVDPWTILLATVGIALVLSGLIVVDTASAQVPKPIELNSTWSDAFALFESQWIDQFGDASQPVSVSNVLATGDQFAKRNLLEGDEGGKKIGLDFILSGTRLTAAELATAKVAYTQIPVAVSSLAVTLRAPIGAGAQGWRTKDDGGCTEDPDTGVETCPKSVPYTLPLKLNPAALFKLYTGEGFELMADPAFRADNNAKFEARSGVFTAAIGRIDPGAIPKNLRAYFGTFSPVDLTAVYKNLKIDPAALRPEEWPFLSKATRSNNASLVNALVQSSTPDGAVAAGGMVGDFDTVNALAMIAQRPAVDLRNAQLKNGAGAFVGPTKDAVLAGINAGLRTGAPDATFVENAGLAAGSPSGAYPMTWLEWLIVPSTGLGAAKANAVATIARFIALAGQADLDAAGAPKLPSTLVASALKSADGLVRSNCTTSGYRVIERNDAGPLAPANLVLPANTSIAWCEQIPVAATTTTTTTRPTTTTTRPPVTTSTVVASTTLPPATTTQPSEPDEDVPVAVLPVTVTRAFTPPVTTASPPTVANVPLTTTTVAADQPAPAVPAASVPSESVALPNVVPVVERAQFDRVTTMGMGGGCLLGAARRYRRKLAL